MSLLLRLSALFWLVFNVTSIAQGWLPLACPSFPCGTIDLNFVGNPSATYSSYLTVNRAGQETCTWADGHVTYAANNAPCITDLGLALYEGRTNFVQQSTSVNSSSPYANAVTGTGSLSVTANAGVAPDLASTATKVTIARADTSSFAVIGTSAFTGTAASYTSSIYVQAFAGGDVGKHISVYSFNGSTVSAIDVTLTASWQRIQVTQTLTTAVNCNMGFGFRSGLLTQTGTVNFLAWGPQQELGSFASPLIVTTNASLARPLDDVTPAGALATIINNSSDGRLTFNTSGMQAATASTLLGVAAGGIGLGESAANKATSNWGSSMTSIPTCTWTGACQSTIAWTSKGSSLTISGFMPEMQSTAPTTASSKIGALTTGAAVLNGYITRLRALAIPDAQPLPAAALLYDANVYLQTFSSISTIDVNNTKASGYLLYLQGGWPGAVQTVWQSFTSGAGSGNVAVAGGVLTLTESGANFAGAQLASAVPVGGSFKGSSFAGGAYIEATWQYDPTQCTPAVASWPVFWVMPTRFLVSSGTSDIVEIDIGEGSCSATPGVGNWTSFIHDWTYSPDPNAPTANTPASGTLTPTPTGGVYFTTGVGWITSTNSGGTGRLAHYYNNLHASSIDQTYSPSGVPSPVLGPSNPSGALSSLDTDSYVFFLGTGPGALSSTWKNISVWCATTACLTVH